MTAKKTELRKGDKVYIINMEMGGAFFIEGRATIMSKVRGVDDVYNVRFDGENSTYQRFVDSAAQENPAEYVKQLNNR